LFGFTFELLVVSLVGAQTAPDAAYTVEVVSAEAVVRSGPSDKFYPTNRLHPGERLMVLGSDPSRQYLRIVPPKGSFSYIETRYVRPLTPNVPTNYVVSEPGIEAPVLIGSEFKEQSRHHPDQESCKLKWGTQVRAVGSPLRDESGTWLPIEPPPAEVRYVLAVSVRRVGENIAVARPSSPTTEKSAPPIPAAKPAVTASANSAPSALAPLPSPQLQLFQQAQQLERQGTAYGLNEAIKLYDRVAQEAASSDPNLAARARAEASTLRQRMAVATNCPPVNVPCSTTYVPPERIYPMSAAEPPSIRLNAPAPSTTTVTPSYQIASASAPAATRPPENNGVYSQIGYLRRAGRSVDDKKRTYRLESPTGYPLMYVTPQAGLDLEPYLNRYVEVFGPASYSGLLRANHMWATRVQPLQ
jgi:hypothetical protein